LTSSPRPPNSQFEYINERMCATAKDDPLPTAQLLGVVRDYLDSQDLFAFTIHLDRQLSEMDFEDRQIIDRSIDHDLVARRSSPLLPLKE
jgi:hypothetical protein